MEKKRLAHIDLLKTIAIFFVILYHGTIYSCNFISDGSFTNYVWYFFRTILSSCVPIFFFVNGYLLFGKSFVLRKHAARTAKLVALTVLWGMITLMLLQPVKHEYFTAVEFLKALLSWKTGWINHLWYMGALVCIYVFLPLMKNAYDNNMKVFLYFAVIGAILTLGNAFLNHAGTVGTSLLLKNTIDLNGFNFFSIFNPFRGIRGYAFVYFCMGGIACYYRDEIEKISATKRNMISVIGILLACLGLFGLGVVYSRAQNALWDVVWSGYDSIFTCCNVIFMYMLALNWKKDCWFIREISSNTLGIYFIHPIIINVLYPLISKLGFAQTFGFNLIYAAGILMVCLLVTSVLKKIPGICKLVK